MSWPHSARRCRICGDQAPNCCARRETKGCKGGRRVLYFDTSFLVPLILPEATSDKIAAFIRRLPAEEFTVSHWTRVEFSSLIAREVRMGGLDVRAAARADVRFESMVDESFSVLLPNADDFSLAKRYRPVRNQITGRRRSPSGRRQQSSCCDDLQPRQDIAAG